MKTRILLLSLFIAGVCAAWAQGPNDSGTYYQNADGKKGAALKTALCGVIYAREEGGDLSTAYKALWTHFRTTDAKPKAKCGICTRTSVRWSSAQIRTRVVAIKRANTTIVSTHSPTAGLEAR